MNILLLASQSSQRHTLLRQAEIPFNIIGHEADETQCDWALPFQSLLESIAVHKMNHAILPRGKQYALCFVLTADTLGQDNNEMIHGKPVNKYDAVNKIKILSKNGVVATAFCLDRKRFEYGGWKTEQRIIQWVKTSYVFDMPESLIEQYFQEFPDYLTVSGGINVAGYGLQFLKSINGSFSTIIGLPLFELRVALKEIGFYKNLL